tara:strand:- start:272 stop:460 length:189 start_codon:yes stop_codon:yes gene_type:complete
LTIGSRPDILIDREVGMHVNAPLLTYLAPNRSGIALHSEAELLSLSMGVTYFYVEWRPYGWS